MIDKHASDLHLYRKLCLIILVLGYQRCSRRRRRRFLLDRSTRQSVIHRWDYINNRMRTSWKKKLKKNPSRRQYWSIKPLKNLFISLISVKGHMYTSIEIQAQCLLYIWQVDLVVLDEGCRNGSQPLCLYIYHIN